MPKNPARVALVAVAALVAHEPGDYVAQTSHQAANKAADGYNPPDSKPTNRESWLANQGHCATYHLTMAAIVGAACAASGVRLNPWRAAAGLAVSWGTHSLLDRRWPVEKAMKWTGSEDYYPDGAPHVDQALHKVFVLTGALIAAA